MKIAIAIPCYNCELQLPRLLLELDSILSLRSEIKKILIIENRSKDNTLKTAVKSVSGLKSKNLFSIYQNPENIGLGGTHKIAFTLGYELEMTHLMILHGDHQASAMDIPGLIEKSVKNEAASVLGSRFSDLRKLSGYSKTRKAGNLALNKIYSLVTRKKITDLGSGLNLFRLSDFVSEHYQQLDNGFAFNMDLLVYMVREKIKFYYIPIKWSNVDQVSNARAFAVGLKALMILFKWPFLSEVQNRSHFKSYKIAND